MDPDWGHLTIKMAGHPPFGAQISCQARKAGGIDVNKPRMRAVLNAVLSLACSPDGLTVGQLAQTVRSLLGATASRYDARRAAYDIRKLRGKGLINKVPESRRYTTPPQAIRTIAALMILREKVLRPILAGMFTGSTQVLWPATQHIVSIGRRASPRGRWGFVCSLARHFGISLSS